MQKAEKKRPVIDANGYELSKKVIKRLPKSPIRNELKKIREENPRLFKALSLDKFD